PAVMRLGAELLHEHRDAGRLALLYDRARPGEVHRAGVRPALPADDHPADAVRAVVVGVWEPTGSEGVAILGIAADEAESGLDLLAGAAAQVNRTEERLGADEADGRRRVEEQREPLVGARLVLDADAQPDVRQRPR